MTLYEREYEVEMSRQPSVIVDAGANIGLASIHFAQRFPDAQVVAIEPDEANFKLLCANVAAWPQVIPVRAAIAADSGTVALIDPGVGPWGYRTIEGIATPSDRNPTIIDQVEALTVTDIMGRWGFDHVDILKLDIEGAEAPLMAASDPWIDRVDVICAELHDRFARGCSLAFYQATRSFDFEWYRGENVFVARSRSGIVPPPAAGR